MACETKTQQIGDHEYSVTQWPATKSLTMKFRLTKAFGASLAILAASKSTSKKDKSSNDIRSLSEGFTQLFENTSPDELVSLMKECVVGVACDGTKITSTSFDELFSGDDLLEVYKVFMFVLKVNYANLMNGQLADRLLAGLKGTL